jgi:hypothetical protein
VDAYLEWLDKSVAARLAEVAPVVFVRAHLQWTADQGALRTVAAKGGAMVARWVGAQEAARDVSGSAAAGSLHALIEFEQGQSALVCVEVTHGTAVEPQTQVLVVGRHGTVRFDDFPDPALLNAGGSRV